MNQAIDLLRQAAGQYGPAGDGTLECVGVTLPGGGTAPGAVKTYRLTPGGKTPAWLPPALRVTADKLAASIPPGSARLADVSTCAGSAAARLCLKLRTDGDPTPHRAALRALTPLLSPAGVQPAPELVDDLLQRTLSPGRASVVQLGAETDGSGTVQVRKSYFSLRSNRVPGDYFFRFPPVSALCPVLAQVRALCGGPDLTGFARFAPALEALDYHPFLLGINQSPRATEYKIYFMLQPIAPHRADVAAHGDAALTAMDVPWAAPLNRAAVACGLFLRGFGYYAAPEGWGWKAYFAPME